MPEQNKIPKVSEKTHVVTSHITHKGKWIIDEEAGLSIDCYVTNDKKRLLSLRATARAMDLTGAGSTALARNLKSQWIQPYLSDNLKQWLADLENDNIGRTKGIGKAFIPFQAELFVDVCKAYIQAKNDGVFAQQQWKSQSQLADRLLKIMSVFAKVGIVALIDEITGYQEERDRDELQRLVALYVREEFMPWTKRFPDEFYKELFRLKGWEYKGKPKPPMVGKLTNYLVYEQLPEGVLTELREKNPLLPDKKRRKHKHHQFLTDETGLPHLDKHLIAVITLEKASDNWEMFEKLFRKTFGLPYQENFDFEEKVADNTSKK